jgi:hypothetical protein
MKINQIKPNVKRFIALHVTVLVIVIFLLLSLGQAPGNNSTSTTDETKTTSNNRDRQKDEIQKKMTESATGNFRLSLEMKENVDFVLTPALLVQEVISEDVVITYPSE